MPNYSKSEKEKIIKPLLYLIFAIIALVFSIYLSREIHHQYWYAGVPPGPATFEMIGFLEGLSLSLLLFSGAWLISQLYRFLRGVTSNA